MCTLWRPLVFKGVTEGRVLSVKMLTALFLVLRVCRSLRLVWDIADIFPVASASLASARLRQHFRSQQHVTAQENILHQSAACCF